MEEVEEKMIIGDYEVVRAIGKGKFAIVYRARRISDGVVVALKRINVDTIDEKSREKCLKEVRLMQSLDHPNVIKYLDSFITENDLVIVVEWAAAGDLKRQLRKAQEKGIGFDERIIWKYFSQICDAMHHMHEKRIMHRDLKPANIFLTLDGTVKVGDLGLSRELSENTVQAHSKVGTPLYMSPEVLRGDGYDFKSDVWSLGCLLYEMAMLKSPFKSEGLNLYSLFQKISQGDYSPLPENYSETLRSLAYSMISTNSIDRPELSAVCRSARAMRESTAEEYALMKKESQLAIMTDNNEQKSSSKEAEGQPNSPERGDKNGNSGNGNANGYASSPEKVARGTPNRAESKSANPKDERDGDKTPARGIIGPRSYEHNVYADYNANNPYRNPVTIRPTNSALTDAPSQSHAGESEFQHRETTRSDSSNETSRVHPPSSARHGGDGDQQGYVFGYNNASTNDKDVAREGQGSRGEFENQGSKRNDDRLNGHGQRVNTKSKADSAYESKEASGTTNNQSRNSEWDSFLNGHTSPTPADQPVVKKEAAVPYSRPKMQPQPQRDVGSRGGGGLERRRMPPGGHGGKPVQGMGESLHPSDRQADRTNGNGRSAAGDADTGRTSGARGAATRSAHSDSDSDADTRRAADDSRGRDGGNRNGNGRREVARNASRGEFDRVSDMDIDRCNDKQQLEALSKSSGAFAQMEILYSKLTVLEYPMHDTGHDSDDEGDGGDRGEHGRFVRRLLPIHFACDLTMLGGVMGYGSSSRQGRYERDVTGNVYAQFRRAVEVAVWLAEAIGGNCASNARKIDIENDAPVTVSKQLLSLSEAAGVPLRDIGDPTPTNLLLGYGEKLCTFLNKLADVALMRSGLLQKRMVYVDETADDINVDPEDGDDDEIVEEDPEFGHDVVDGSNAAEDMAELSGKAEVEHSMVHATIDPVLWRAEVERVTPLLAAARKNTASGGDTWGTHLSVASEHAAVFATSTDGRGPSRSHGGDGGQGGNGKAAEPSNGASVSSADVDRMLQAVARELSDNLKAIARGESVLTGKSQLNSLSSDFSGHKIVLTELEENLGRKSKAIETFTHRLSEIEDQLDDARDQLDSRVGGTDGDANSSLVRLKEALRIIKEDNKQKALQMGLVSSQVTSYRMQRAVKMTQKRRAKRAKRSNFGLGSRRKVSDDADAGDSEIDD